MPDRAIAARNPRMPQVDVETLSGEETMEVPIVKEGQAREPLNDPRYFINRELSLLEFHRRVLAQARDPRAPLLERLRFLTIVSAILDEFFEIRVASLQQDVELGLNARGPDEADPADVLRKIGKTARALVSEQYRMLNQELLPALDEEDIRLLKRSTWNARLRTWVEEYFVDEVLPVLTPMGLDPAHPFPNVQNKGLAFVVNLEGDDAFERDSGIAIVPVPRSLPRLIPLPREMSKGAHEFVMLSSVIHANIGKLFPGMKVTGCHQFRLTRNSNLWVEEEEADDLLRALKSELPRRRFGAAVRLEVSDECTHRMADFLLNQFGLDPVDLFRVHGPVNLHRLAALYDLVDRPDLKFRPFMAGLAGNLGPKSDIFATLTAGDVLLHHPYQSFQPVLHLLRQAATDPTVLAIKMTLYRTGADSPVVEALLDAARNGKEITAVVELRARFDEDANIKLATRFQEVGVNVAYGIVGYKAHAKLLMIVRREVAGLRRYVHMGTGNYHAGTSRAYTDWSLLTANEAIGDDVHRIFNQLTGLGGEHPLSHLLMAPFSLHKELLRLIDAEADAARRGDKARIIAKMNALTEPLIIRALYAASQAGVSIDLIVRGACRLRPGMPGISHNIRVRSVVGRFLEHDRVYYFLAGGREVVLCGSADWMARNLIRRIEVAFPILDPALKQRVIDESLHTYLGSDEATWELDADGSYALATVRPEAARVAQATLMERHARPAAG